MKVIKILYFRIAAALLCALIFMVFSAAALAASGAEQSNARNLVELLDQSGIFEVFLAAVKLAGLEEKLSKDGPYTVLAPRDAAFASVSGISQEKLLSNKLIARKFVEQHVVVGDLGIVDLSRIDLISSLGSYTLSVEHKTPLEIGRAKVMRSDIRASNGVVFMLGEAVIQE